VTSAPPAAVESGAPKSRVSAPRRVVRGWPPYVPALMAALAVAVGLCTLAVPLLHSGFPAGHDLSAHLTYTYLFDRALGGGQFPVRWTQSVRVGDGQPLFSFYQPGFYYVVEAVHLVVPSLGWSMKLAVAGLWACGAAFMCGVSASRGWMAAALGAVVFAGAPYLLLDVNVRAAYPELAAIACSVGVLWALARLCESPGAGRAALLACLLAAALVCHLPATLIFSTVFVARAIVGLLAAPDRRRSLVWCATAVLLAAGLSAFYVAPALGERHLIQMHALTTDYFDYRKHFVEPAQWFRYRWGFGASEPGSADGMSFQVGILQWGLIVVALGCALRAAARRHLTREDRDLVFWLAVVAFALFMTSSASLPVWRAIPPMSYVQFPWRFLMLVAVAGGALASNLLARLPPVSARAVVLTLVVILQIAVSREQRRPDHYVPRRAMDIDRVAWGYTSEARKAAFVEPGYYPVVPASDQAGREAGVPLDRAEAAIPVGRWTPSDPRATVTPRRTADHLVELELQSDAGTDLTLATRLFPGWVVRLDDREIPVSADPPHGFMRVSAPPGAHTLTAEFTETRLRRIANATSATSAAVIVLLIVASARVSRRASPGS
jgi:hypothetical protein